MTNLAQWSALVGFVVPLLVAIVQQSHWSRPVRTAIGVAAVLATAIITAWTENRLTWNTWATSLIWVATTAFTAYRNLWVPLGAIDWVEAVTSKRSVHAVKSARKLRTGEASHGRH